MQGLAQPVPVVPTSTHFYSRRVLLMACPFVSCILFLDKNKVFVKILFHKDNDTKTKSN